MECTEGGCDGPVIETTPGEKCILNCAESSVCRGDVLNCRDDNPCEIKGDNTRSCESADINANEENDLTVICNTHISCKMADITCGTVELQCYNPTACANWAWTMHLPHLHFNVSVVILGLFQHHLA